MSKALCLFILLMLSGCALPKRFAAAPGTVTMYDGNQARVVKPFMQCPKGYALEWTCYGQYCKGDYLRLTWMCVREEK